jgi:hypothetical protein
MTVQTRTSKPAAKKSTPRQATKSLAQGQPDDAAKKPPPKAADESVAAGKKAPKPKEKLVRDSFTMPQEDYAVIASLKERTLRFKRPTKKSELLRAGLHALQAMPAAALREALDALTPLKAGRPRRDHL